jgi:phosphosulfolactate synthase
MEYTFTARAEWQPLLRDPSGCREEKPRLDGKTMVIDKGIGIGAFADMLETAAPYIDFIKIGFGTSPLYPLPLLRKKVELAKSRDIVIYPGGTFLEVAVRHGETDAFFDMVRHVGFNGIEVSDGTIEMTRDMRNRLIDKGRELGLAVVTEYGKKASGSEIEVGRFLETFFHDLEYGADMVILEGRESGKGVGLYDDRGNLKDAAFTELLKRLDNTERIMWEAPLKSQQVHLLKTIGPRVNLGNIPGEDILSLECLRRGLRSDTFVLKGDG